MALSSEGDEVAIKVTRRGDDEAVQRALQEARSMQACRNKVRK